MKPRTRKPTDARLQAAQQFQAPLPTAHPIKTPENGAMEATGLVQQCLDNPIIQSLLEKLMDGTKIEVKK